MLGLVRSFTPPTIFPVRCAGCVLLLLISLSSVHAEIVIEDIFGRRVNENGLVLVDWDGQIANPAIKFFIVPPRGVTFPARAVITCKEPRVYFNLPCELGPTGPRKVVEFKDKDKQPVLVSIFQSRTGGETDPTIDILFQDARGRRQALKLKCNIVDQHVRKNEQGFPFTVDFSWDRTGFFKDDKRRQVVLLAVRDWAYFFEPLALDPVPAGKEKWYTYEPDSLSKGQFSLNPQSYSGYLLHVYGTHTNELHSVGEASITGGFQSVKGKEIPLRRSGSSVIEIQGNDNNKGWLVSLDDADFWKATNLRDVPNDLYSIVHHEMAHSFFFIVTYPLCKQAAKTGLLESPAIKEYYGSGVKIDAKNHFPETVDPASRRGIFGNEFHGDMPLMRWQITKLDLLCAQAIGYPLRMTSAFVPVTLKTDALPGGTVGTKYEARLRVTGGIPFYNWEVTSGSLPAGLRLNSFTGWITGTPTKIGVSDFTISVRDYDEKAATKSVGLRLEIGSKSN
jgi:hypothetical protein